MSELRIAHVINSMGLGGVPAVVYHLLRTLPAARYEPLLYVLRGATDHLEVREQQAARFRELGVQVRFPTRDDQKFMVVAELCRWIQADELAILHTHSYKPNIYGRIAGTLCKTERLKIIGHYHNQYDNKWASEGTLIYDQLLARSSDRLLACSESVRRHVIERVGVPAERVELLLNGVDLARYAAPRDRQVARRALEIEPGAQVVGVVGRIAQQKGQDTLIRAARQILAHAPNTIFLLAGAPDEQAQLDRLMQLAAAEGVAERVRLLGYISDMPLVYAALDVLAVPSRWEGFGLILVEAMAAGVPIVATRVGAIPEIVTEEHTALLVPPDDPPALAAAIGRLLAQPMLAVAFGRHGRTHARQFGWEQRGRQLDAIYSELLTNP